MWPFIARVAGISLSLTLAGSQVRRIVQPLVVDEATEVVAAVIVAVVVAVLWEWVAEAILVLALIRLSLIFYGFLNHFNKRLAQ